MYLLPERSGAAACQDTRLGHGQRCSAPVAQFLPFPLPFLPTTSQLSSLLNRLSENPEVAAEINARLRTHPDLREPRCLYNTKGAQPSGVSAAPEEGSPSAAPFLTGFLKPGENSPSTQEITLENRSRERHDIRLTFPASNPAQG